MTNHTTGIMPDPIEAYSSVGKETGLPLDHHLAAPRVSMSYWSQRRRTITRSLTEAVMRMLNTLRGILLAGIVTSGVACGDDVVSPPISKSPSRPPTMWTWQNPLPNGNYLNAVSLCLPFNPFGANRSVADHSGVWRLSGEKFPLASHPPTRDFGPGKMVRVLRVAANVYNCMESKG